jgi:hypothetical protein
MNKDNFSPFVIAIGVVSLIVGFAVYFNSPELNKAVSGQGRGTTNFVPAIQVDKKVTMITLIQRRQLSRKHNSQLTSHSSVEL